jgi:hypothetical protein
MKTPLYFVQCVQGHHQETIRYEVPQIYVWGLEADGSWLSVNKKYSKRKGLRSFPNGINDVEHFVTHLGEVDQNKINELIQNKGHDLKKYDMERFWKEFKDQESTFIHYQVYQPSLSGNHCSSFLGNTLKSINNAE